MSNKAENLYNKIKDIFLAEESKESVEKPQEQQFVSMSEFTSAMAEMKQMYSKLLEMYGNSTHEQVPSALSAEEIAEKEVVEEVELSEEEVSEEVTEEATTDEATEEAEEEIIEVTELSKENTTEEVELSTEEEVIHSPESEVSKTSLFKIGAKRPQNTTDVVFNKLFNK